MLYMGRKKIVSVLVVVSALIGVGFLFGHTMGNRSSENIQPLREKTAGLRFVEPLLAVGNFELLRDFDSLKNILENKVSEYTISHKAERISIYYRDLQSGRWTGVNEDVKYAPASMYKVPLAITILKAAESDPTLLNKRLKFTGSLGVPGEEELSPYLKVGESYSVVELLEYLIVNSDNDAKNLLHTLVSSESRKEVFIDLGLTPPNETDTGDILSAKNYSIFFRVLYNGTYLAPNFSEAVLELLSRPEFTEGIVAGVPQGVKVAHKFGRRVFNQGLVKKEELHDCGNIYFAEHPYFLCVMTEGVNDKDLTSVIADISKTVFDYTQEKYK